MVMRRHMRSARSLWPCRRTDVRQLNRTFAAERIIDETASEAMTEPSQCVAVLGVWPYLLKASKGRAVGIVERQGWIGGIRVDNLHDLNSNTSVVVMSMRGDYDLSHSWTCRALLRN